MKRIKSPLSLNLLLLLARGIATSRRNCWSKAVRCTWEICPFTQPKSRCTSCSPKVVMWKGSLLVWIKWRKLHVDSASLSILNVISHELLIKAKCRTTVFKCIFTLGCELYAVWLKDSIPKTLSLGPSSLWWFTIVLTRLCPTSLNPAERYYTRGDAENAMRFLNGTRLDDRIIRTDWDAGFKEGRQYGRGKSGGQVSWPRVQDVSLYASWRWQVIVLQLISNHKEQ